MGKRNSIYLPAEVLPVINSFGGKLSTTLSTIVLRYDKITREAVPEFTLQEWKLICQALKGSVLSSGGYDPAAMCWATIGEYSAGYREIGEKVRALPLICRIAVWDVALRANGIDAVLAITEDILLDEGARIKYPVRQ